MRNIEILRGELVELYGMKYDMIMEQRYEDAAVIKRAESSLRDKLKTLLDEYELIIFDSLKKEIKDE